MTRASDDAYRKHVAALVAAAPPLDDEQRVELRRALVVQREAPGQEQAA